MGSYNSEYENYYNSLKKNGRATYSPSYNKGNVFNKMGGNTGGSKGNYFVKRIIRDLIGVFVLFSLVIVCRIIVTPKTQAVYNFSKEVLNENYDYKGLKEKAKDIDLKDLQNKILNTIEQVKSKITGKETIESRIKQEFALPVEDIETSALGQGNITEEKNPHEGIDIDVKENTDVIACFDGRVRECGEDEQLGKYILIDNGDGIETKYGNLNKILVSKEDAVKKSQVIAKSGNTGKSTKPHLHFELLYMGEYKNPFDYFNIIKK